MLRGTPVVSSVHTFHVPVRPPFRLDLTANVLRRLATNAVDVFDGTTYRRLVDASGTLALLTVTQSAPDALAVAVSGGAGIDGARLARRMFGTDADLSPFYHGCRDIPWLHALANGARGVKPPRYASLWEAVVNAVVYQQISIHAASAILRRVVERYAARHDVDGVGLFAFPGPRALVDADAEELRRLGLSIQKVVALRTLAYAVLEGALDDAALEELATSELTTELARHKGIGPWTAAVIALRGFGRLDVFPMRDSGVARSLRDLSGDEHIKSDAILAALGPQPGMLYYHLLLGRLVARGDIVF